MAAVMSAEGDEPKTQGFPNGTSRWTPSIPTNLINMLNPFANDDDETNSTKSTKDSNVSSASQASNKRISLLASILPVSFASEPVSPSKDDDSVMFAEPETRSTSDDGSRDGSIDELSGRGRAKKSGITRSKTSYSICHPPPASTTRQRLHRRPRSLLQLHRLSSSTRPQPAFEVIPSANFSVRSTKAIAKVFKTKHGLGPNDLVLLRAEDYSTEEADEDQQARHVLALICKPRKEEGPVGKARICLPDGQEWEAYPTPNGGYEFFTTDEHGLGVTARWVQKKHKDGSRVREEQSRRFNFSTISPNCRRHPVIAALSKNQLAVNDVYRMPDPANSTPHGTPKQNSILADAMEEEGSAPKELLRTDDGLRELIVVTSIWVALKEGWSPILKYDDNIPSISPAKAATFPSSSATPPASPSLQKRSSIKSVGSGILRSTSRLGNGTHGQDRGSIISVATAEESKANASTAPASSVLKSPTRGRSRADSSSTVLVHRAASNRQRARANTLSRQVEEGRTSTVERGRVNEQPRREMVGASSRSVPRRADSGPGTEEETDEDGDESADKTQPEPLLPPAQPVTSPTPAPAPTVATVPVTPRLRVAGFGSFRSDREREKRASNATTMTSASSAGHGAAGMKGRSVSRKSGWRRLLCGGGDGGEQGSA